MMSLAVDIGLGLLLGLGVSAVLIALGERIRALLRIPSPRAVRPAVSFAFGSWALGVVLLVCGLLGGFRPQLLLPLLLLSALGGRWRGLPGLARELRWLGLAALPLLPAALAPPFFYDSWVYHLGLPWQALRDGALRGHSVNLFSTFPPLAQLIYAEPLAAGLSRATGLIHLIGFVAGGSAVAFLARRLGAARLPAMLAGVCVLYLPTAALVPALPAAEAWMLASIAAAVVLAVSGRPPRVAALGAGLLAGIACAARLQGLPWLVLIGLLLAARSPRLAPRLLGPFAIAAVCGSLPWWLKNAVLLGEPFAPIGWTREGVATLWRDASSNLNLASGPVNLILRVVDSLTPLLLLLVPLLVAGLIGFFARRGRATSLVFLGAVAGIAVWSLTGALGRFLTPSLALLLALAAAAGRRRVRLGVAVAVTGGLLLWGATGAWGVYRSLGGLSVLGEPSAVYASTVVADPYPAFRACDGLPDDARLLLVCEPRGFLLPRRFETTSQHDPSLLTAVLAMNASPRGAARELRKLGYTHLLVNVSEMRRLGSTYPVLPWRDEAGRNRFVGLTSFLGQPVVLENDVVVYRLGNP